MGRVDEAMRRAAEATGASSTAELPLSPDSRVTETADVRQDGFPAEGRGPERHLREVRSDPPMPQKPPPSLVERISSDLSRKVVIDREIDPISREQYRRLATALHAAQGANGLKVIAVSSALASEGKSLTASNLAMTLSESYQRSVLLIDGDLRRPSLAQLFGLPSGGAGLSDGVLGQGDSRLNLHRVTPHLSVLTAGRLTADPMTTLSSPHMRQLVAEARETFDWVVVDTPPIGLLSDASLLADIADGTLMVIRAQSTPYDIVQKAVSALGRERILGVVLNQAEDVGSVGTYQSYYYGAATP